MYFKLLLYFRQTALSLGVNCWNDCGNNDQIKINLLIISFSNKIVREISGKKIMLNPEKGGDVAMMPQTFQYEETDYTTRPLPTVTFHQAEGCAMPDTYFRNRPVYFGKVHLAGVNSFFENAFYADTFEEFNDRELNDLTEQCSDYLIEQNCLRFGYYPK